MHGDGTRCAGHVFDSKYDSAWLRGEDGSDQRHHHTSCKPQFGCEGNYGSGSPRRMQAWHDHISAALKERSYLDARVWPPKEEEWGAHTTYAIDPSGVLIHFAQWIRR
jgi:hypothetical protein